MTSVKPVTDEGMRGNGAATDSFHLLAPKPIAHRPLFPRPLPKRRISRGEIFNPAIRATLEGHTGVVTCVSLSSDGKHAVSGSEDTTVRLWDMEYLEPNGVLRGHTSGITKVSMSADGKRILTTSKDSGLQIFEIKKPDEMRPVLIYSAAAAKSACMSANGKRVAVVMTDNLVLVRDISNAERTRPVISLEGVQVPAPVQTVDLDYDGSFLVCVLTNGKMKLWDIQGEALTYGSSIYYPVASVAVGNSPIGYLVAIGVSRNLVVREMRKARKHGVFRPITREFSWSTTAGVLSSSLGAPAPRHTKSVRYQQVLSERTLTGHEGDVTAACISPNGCIIVSGSDDKTVRVWNAATGSPMCLPLVAHDSKIRDVSVDRAANTIISCSDETTITVWDMTGGESVDDSCSEREIEIVQESSDGSDSETEGMRCSGIAVGELVQKIMTSIDIPLSRADMYIFKEFRDYDLPPLTSNEVQMEYLGIIYDDQPLNVSREESQYFAQFTPAHLGKRVTVDIRRISPAGMSILLWILPPSPEYCDLVELVMQKTTFKNCFIEEVLGEQRQGPTRNLVIPKAWASWLGVSDEFITEHTANTTEGILAICLGLFRAIPSGTQLLRRTRARLQRSQISSNLQTDRSTLPMGSESNDGNGEHLLLLREDSSGSVPVYSLIYQPRVINEFETTQLTIGFQVMGTGVNVGRVRQRTVESVANKNNISKGFVTKLESFAMFLRLPLRTKTECTILGRVRWLRRIMESKKVFPYGLNRGFLEATCRNMTSYDQVKMFSNLDCKVPIDVLHENRVRGSGLSSQDMEHSVMFTEDSEHETVHSVVKGMFDESASAVRVMEFTTMVQPPNLSPTYIVYDLV